MKKITFLVIASLLFMTSVTAQRIGANGITVEGLTPLTPVGAFNPTNNDASKPGDAQMVFPAGTDLSNVSVTISAGADAEVISPIPLPKDWTSTVKNIKIEKTDKTAWAMYDVTLKTIKPAALPLEIKTGAGNFDSNSWTNQTVGWAGAAIDKNQNLIRFGSANRSFVVAFTDAPDSLYYTLKFLASPWDTGNVFDVDGSADGINWTSIHQYNADNAMPGASPAVVAKFEINPTYRYIRWNYTTRKSANVSLENIKVTLNPQSGVNNHWVNRVNLYPINSNTLHLDNAEHAASIQLYTLTGAKVMEQATPSSTIKFENTSGMYIGIIKMKDGSVISKKFIK